jgi:hypothetical protein
MFALRLQLFCTPIKQYFIYLMFSLFYSFTLPVDVIIYVTFLRFINTSRNDKTSRITSFFYNQEIISVQVFVKNSAIVINFPFLQCHSSVSCCNANLTSNIRLLLIFVHKISQNEGLLTFSYFVEKLA